MATDLTRAKNYFKRGVYYYERGQWEDAINNLKDAQQFYPDHALVGMYLGAALAQMGLYLDAIRILEDTRQQPSLDEVLQFQINRLLGVVCMRRKDYPAAVYYLKLAYQLQPEDPKLVQLLASASCKNKEFKDGFAFFLQAEQLLRK